MKVARNVGEVASRGTLALVVVMVRLWRNGSAAALGAEGSRFKSSQPDQPNARRRASTYLAASVGTTPPRLDTDVPNQDKRKAAAWIGHAND